MAPSFGYSKKHLLTMDLNGNICLTLNNCRYKFFQKLLTYSKLHVPVDIDSFGHVYSEVTK